jgi:hypothetical protein
MTTSVLPAPDERAPAVRAGTSLGSILVVLALVAAGCGGAAIRPFPARPPMARDPDTTPFSPRPAKYAAHEVWDTVDNTVFGPVVDALSLERHGRARNVNALDEVPDSSWFENRIDLVAGDLDAFARGACTDAAPDPAGPWTVVAGKPDGANPGFTVTHADGRKFMFKPDVAASGQRQGAADVIGTRVYHAAGFHTACTRIAYVDPAAFVIAPDATTRDFVGDKIPFTQAMLDAALAGAVTDARGAVRGELSQFIDGTPIGPWRDFGTRPDDPNDVIPHEHRRELRGSYVLGAWLGHYDAREQNSLDSWISTGGDAGYVRHYMFDFGDCLGSMSSWPRVSGRRGHAYELDWSVAFVELVTFGALDRPWRDPKLGPGGKTLGYFAAEPFAPDAFRTAYPYGPYARVTEADAAWGARILARITPAAIHAMIGEARLSDPVVAATLEQTLLDRREALLRRYLTKLSPLARPRVDGGGRLCVIDARAEGGVLDRPATITARAIDGLGAATLAVGPADAPGESCTSPLPPGSDYGVVELRADGTSPLRVHVYAGEEGYRVAGLER